MSQINASRSLSLPIKPGMLRFPGDPDPLFRTSSEAFGPGLNIMMTQMTLGLHVGTHIDAPAHFIPGAKTIDQLDPEIFRGEVLVINLESAVESISRSDLEGRGIGRGTKIFIRTRNSKLLQSEVYDRNHVYLESDAARFLVEKGVSLFGFDYYNIDSSAGSTLDSHLILAAAGIPAIVAISMSDVEEGHYLFSADPLTLVGVEASPVNIRIWNR